MGLDTEEMYLQGMSSSLPEDVQISMMRSIPGLEQVSVMRSAYAIEYDCIDATQLKLSLEFKKLDGLFSAGQINGSSGYEEAAAQGLIAGINAALKTKGKDPLILDRSQAYIGVLIDDLITKGTQEPYRMMTSRSEYRLLLRQDNADLRLTPAGYEAGLISEERYRRFEEKRDRIRAEIERLEKTTAVPLQKVNELLESKASTPIKSGIKLVELLRRPELNYEELAVIDEGRPELPFSVREQVELSVKYEGYIKRQMMQVEQFKKLEGKKLPAALDYNNVQGLRIEARQKLNQIKPGSIGQASRISGVSPADISVLLIYLEQMRRGSTHP
jgi:tRNA uridine 5-carboxymethylaminomethyl modification enzyme